MITREALLAAGFSSYDPQGAVGDVCCRAFFQKIKEEGYGIHVTFWQFKIGGPEQINLNVEGALEGDVGFDLEIKGLPSRMTIPKLEAYAAVLVQATRVLE